MTRYEVTGYQKDGTEVTICITAECISVALNLAKGNNIVRVSKITLIPDKNLLLDMNWEEDEIYMSIFSTLLLSGEYSEKEIDDVVDQIMDNPEKYPEYFPTTQTVQ